MKSSRREPVRHTCPDIDKCIKRIIDTEGFITSAIRAIEKADGDLNIENEEAANAIKDAMYYLNDALDSIDFSEILEEIRSSNLALRNWGHSLASECEELENKL